MPQQTINVGTAPDDLTAESILSAFGKINAMGAELFTRFSLLGRQVIDLDATPDTIRDAFLKTNANLAALYTELGLPSVPVIDVGDAPDDPVPTAEMIYAGFVKVNTAMAAVYGEIVEPPITGPVVAFPGATGFGTNTRHAYAGGSAPTIIRINTLADTTAALTTNGDGTKSGTFRSALLFAGPRILVFERSGTIVMSSRVDVTSPYFWIAGQTAPAPGITVNNRNGLRIATHDVLIQHMRFRRGDYSQTSDYNALWLRGSSGVFNVVIDHCSLSWGTDETLTIDYPAGGSGVHDIAVLDSIISEALRQPWPTQAPHSTAVILGPGAGNSGSFNRNLVANANNRLPVVQGGWRLQMLNNVRYNAGAYGANTSNGGSLGGFSMFQGLDYGCATLYFSTQVLEAVMAGNRTVHGPDTLSMLKAWAFLGLPTGSRVYLADNTGTLGTDWSDVQFQCGTTRAAIDAVTAPSWHTALGVTVLPSSAVESHVLTHAGARPLNRDAVDTRVCAGVSARTGRIINSQNDVGGMPALAVNIQAFPVPANPHTVAGSGYTNLEETLATLKDALEP